MHDHARALLAAELHADAPILPMLLAGRLDDTIELAALREAIAIGVATAVPAAARTPRARTLLAAAFMRVDQERGGSMVTRGCARAVRTGEWDGKPLMRAIERALTGASTPGAPEP